MEVKLPRTVTLNQVTAIIAIVVFLFGVLAGVLYMKWTGEQNTQQINNLSETQKERIKVVDGRFNDIENKVNDVRIGLTEVKTKVEASQTNQAVIIGQIQQLQNSVTNLTAAIVKEKVASIPVPTIHPAVYEASR